MKVKKIHTIIMIFLLAILILTFTVKLNPVNFYLTEDMCEPRFGISVWVLNSYVTTFIWDTNKNTESLVQQFNIGFIIARVAVFVITGLYGMWYYKATNNENK